MYFNVDKENKKEYTPQQIKRMHWLNIYIQYICIYIYQIESKTENKQVGIQNSFWNIQTQNGDRAVELEEA